MHVRLLVYTLYVLEELVAVFLGLFYHKLVYLVHGIRVVLVLSLDHDGHAFALPVQPLVVDEYRLIAAVHFALWYGLFRTLVTI